MFPSTDFNFVVAGIATFAATVGYACSRRLASSSSSSPHPDTLRDTIMTDAKSVEEDAHSLAGTDSEALSESSPSEASMIVETRAHSVSDSESIKSMVDAPSAGGIMIFEASSAPVDIPVGFALPIPLPTRKASLKRKAPHDGFDETSKEALGYPYNLARIYAYKRSRTPSSSKSRSSSPTPIAPSESHESVKADATEVKVEITETTTVDREPSVEATPIPERERAPSPEAVSVALKTPEPTPPPTLAITEVEVSPAPVLAPAPLLAAPRLIVAGPKVVKPASTTSSTTFAFPPSSTPNPFAAFANTSGFGTSTGFKSPPRPSTPKKAFTSTSTGGFASFASTTSPFGTFGKSPQQSSAFSTSSTGLSAFSAPALSNEESAEAFLNDLLPSLEAKNALAGTNDEALAPTPQTAPMPEVATMTGEEGEEVEGELRGLKLYIKRGDRAFSEGIFGHIKLLTNLATDDQRLLFRRDPLLKVSMNIRLQSTVRATYTPEENVLKLILKEVVEVSPTESKQEVVIYALKPSKSCNKQSFKRFAQEIVDNENLLPPAQARSA